MGGVPLGGPRKGTLKEAGPCVQEFPECTGEDPRHFLLHPGTRVQPRPPVSLTIRPSACRWHLSVASACGTPSTTTWQEWLRGSASTSTNSGPQGAGLRTPSSPSDHPPWAAPGFRQQADSVAHGDAGRPGPPPPPEVLRCCYSSSRRRPGALPPRAPHTVAQRVTLHGPRQAGPPAAAISNTIPCILQAG